jgi:hypothetical protein
MSDGYPSVHKPPAPQDLDDIGDRLAVLESVVEDLSMPLKQHSEVLILMTQYAHLEDAVLSGIGEHMKLSRTDSDQQKLLHFISLYNNVGFEFQETWSDDYWEMYERVREGHTTSKLTGVRNKPVKQLAQELQDVQDLALGLCKLDRVSVRTPTRPIIPKPQTLLAIDQEARKFRDLKPEPKRRCQDCGIM